MFKIDSIGATAGNEFEDKDSSSGVAGTHVSARWLNAVQRELVAILTAAGVTPVKANDHQVVDAINYLISQSTGGGGGGSPYWIDAVANTGLLPTTGQLTGAIALVQADNTLYRYSGSAWLAYFRASDFAVASTAVTLTGTQNLTNKTLTAPVITAPTGIVKADVGLPNIDNTSDANKPVSSAQATAIALKQDLSAKGVANGYAGLDGTGKVPASQLPAAVVGQVTYQGSFTPASGYPASPVKGYYYIASAAGTISSVDYNVGDWAIYNGTTWDKIDNTDAVFSVNGMLGAVVLTSDNVNEGSTNKYFSDERAQDAIGLLLQDSASIDVTYNDAGNAETMVVIPGGIEVDALAATAPLSVAKGGTGGNSAIKGANVFGGLIRKIISTTQTLEPGYWYLTDTSGGAFSVTLPPLSSGARLRISDAAQSWATNNLTVIPATGEAIGNAAVNASYICNVKNGWMDLAEFTTKWSILSFASSTALIGAGGLSPEIMTTSRTALPNKMYLVDTSAGPLTLTFPSGTTESSVGFLDGGETFNINPLTLVPAAGQSFFNYPVDDPITVSQVRASAVAYRALGSSVHKFALQGVSNITSGAGEKNYFATGSNDASGWLTSGSMVVTTETTASNFPANATQKTALKFLATASGAYAYKRFMLDTVDLGRKLKVALDQAYAGAQGNYSIAIYSNTASGYSGTSTLLPLSPDGVLPSGTGPIITKTFDTPTATQAAPYLEVRVISNVTTPGALYVNNFLVGPGVIGQVPIISQEFASNNGSGGTAAGSSYTTGQVSGETGSNFVAINSTTANGSQTAYAVDFSDNCLTNDEYTLEYQTPTSITWNNVAGSHLDLEEAGSNTTTGLYRFGMRLETTQGTGTLNRVLVIFGNGGARLTGADGTSGEAWSAYAGWKWRVRRIRVIQNVNLGAGAQVEYAYNTDITDASNSTAFATGSQGARFGSFTAARAKRVQFSSPTQNGQVIELQVTVDGGSTWLPIGQSGVIHPASVQNTMSYGSYIDNVSTTQVDAVFSTYRIATGATYGVAGTNWTALSGNTLAFWRVARFNPSTPVGFGLATATDSGLVSGNGGYPGSLTGLPIAQYKIGEMVGSQTAVQSAAFTASTTLGLQTLPLTKGEWWVIANVLPSNASAAVGSYAQACVTNVNASTMDTSLAANDRFCRMLGTNAANSVFSSGKIVTKVTVNAASETWFLNGLIALSSGSAVLISDFYAIRNS